MSHGADGPSRQPLFGRPNVMIGVGLLVLLFFIGRSFPQLAELMERHPLKPFAVGAIEEFSFRSSGTAAPPVTFTGPVGEELTLAHFEGRVVLVNLWATWCAPCVAELPSLARLEEALGGPGFEVVAINMDSEGAPVAAPYLEEHQLAALGLYTDPGMTVAPALGAPDIPTSVLFGADGREIGRLVGPAEWDAPEAKRLVEAALAPRPEGER